MENHLKKILMDAKAAGFGVCSYKDDFAIKSVSSYSRLPGNPKSIIVILFPYLTPQSSGGNVAFYSMLPDYHKVVGNILNTICQSLEQAFKGNCFVPFVDSSPIKEVAAAVAAGVGVLGKNGLLITKDYGAMTFIGTIVTDLEIECNEEKGVCSGCGDCVKACPTGAISENGVNQSLCRSAITQKKAALTKTEEAEIKLGGLIWGCDICSKTCPYSKNAKFTEITEFLENVVPEVTLENLEQIYPKSAFNWRGKAVIIRNIHIVLD